MTTLSEDAVDSLLNAIPRVGGQIGIMKAEKEDEVIAELQDFGYIGTGETLTKAGLAKALDLKRARWGMAENDA